MLVLQQLYFSSSWEELHHFCDNGLRNVMDVMKIESTNSSSWRMWSSLLKKQKPQTSCRSTLSLWLMPSQKQYYSHCSYFSFKSKDMRQCIWEFYLAQAFAIEKIVTCSENASGLIDYFLNRFLLFHLCKLCSIYLKKKKKISISCRDEQRKRVFFQSQSNNRTKVVVFCFFFSH